ncbi:MAG: hypothetical protein WCQ67_00370 [Treponema sp.]
MAVVVTAIILCLINILLWIILAIKFKKIFSTEEIIQKTRDELNKMLADVNRNADRNITLIDEKIKELKSVTAEADRHLKIAKLELEKNFIAEDFQSKINATKQNNKINPVNQANIAKIYQKEQSQGELFSSSEPKGDIEKSVKIPIIAPQIYMADKPIQPKKTFNEQVKEKYDRGESIEEIAADLDRSTQEVEIALEFSN